MSKSNDLQSADVKKHENTWKKQGVRGIRPLQTSSVHLK